MEGQSCPIEARKVDNSAGRITSLAVAALLLVALLTPAKWLLVAVLADYLLRVLAGPGKSPLCWTGRRAASALGLPRRPVNAAPKRFAAWLATAFVTIGVLAVYALDAPFVATAAVGVFAACAFLDGAFGFCVGCRVYALLQWARRAIGRTSRPSETPASPATEATVGTHREAA